ncbi:hypothetical protein Acr_22g0007310 [Actinidia rufa]|uniref:ER membrane protein complex subunit 10 n=1 Tax=Actinidia rufa TaxID=165716 RepID=A0A7J0GKK7_9ERIC|nr:hypothetical protein Acr_22g0007310 [Actinidia rufa]
MGFPNFHLGCSDDDHFPFIIPGAISNIGAPELLDKLESAKWSFNSRTVLKSSKQAQRTSAFAEQILGVENVDGEALPPPERSFWAKYWMYLIPLGLIVMNAMTQAMNIPEEQASGQPGSQTQQTGAAS